MSDSNENEVLPPDEFASHEHEPEVIPETIPEAFLPEEPVVDAVSSAVSDAVIPPVEKPVEPVVVEPVIVVEPLKPADRSTMSQSTMFFGLAALSLSMLGIGFLIFDVFQNGLTDNFISALVKGIPITLAYIVGLVLCLVSMRSFSNLVLPIFIKYYIWVTLAGLVILYLKIMQKLFEQTYDMAHFFSYNVVLVTGLVWLIGLHLLLDQQDLRRSSIPIIMGCIWHLILMVIRFVVLDQTSKPVYLFGDLYFFVVMFGLASLMLAHLGILNPLRRSVNMFFRS